MTSFLNAYRFEKKNGPGIFGLPVRIIINNKFDSSVENNGTYINAF